MTAIAFSHLFSFGRRIKYEFNPTIHTPHPHKWHHAISYVVPILGLDCRSAGNRSIDSCYGWKSMKYGNQYIFETTWSCNTLVQYFTFRLFGLLWLAFLFGSVFVTPFNSWWEIFPLLCIVGAHVVKFSNSFNTRAQVCMLGFCWDYMRSPNMILEVGRVP